MSNASLGRLPILLVTRPAEEAGRTVAAANEAGFSALVAPLLRIVSRDWVVPDGRFDALLFTSGRTPRIVADHHPALLALPAWCVGAHTAREATCAGFAVAGAGSNDASAIVAAAAAHGVRRMLQPGGVARAPMQVPAGVEVLHVPVYAAEPVDRLPSAAAAALREEQIFASLLFSPRTAGLFRKLLDGRNLRPGRLRVVALSDAVAAAAGPGWRATAVAASPDIKAALAAATSLWQAAAHG